MILVVLIIFCATLQAQVGIGTTTPSSAAMLEISSQTDNTGPFKGLMPPRVPTVVERDLIPVTAQDDGLLVYIQDTGCLQIWNGISWENIHCNNTFQFINYYQNFDLNTNWGYSSDVSFFDDGIRAFFGITDTSRGNFSHLTTMTNNFLGINDLNNLDRGGMGTSGFATITFNTIDVSMAVNGGSISFNYEFYQFDNGDDAFYTVIIDNIPQPEVLLINGNSNLSLAGSIIENFPAGTNTVSLKIRIKQDGKDDYAGFDNFALVAN